MENAPAENEQPAEAGFSTPAAPTAHGVTTEELMQALLRIERAIAVLVQALADDVQDDPDRPMTTLDGNTVQQAGESRSL